METSGPGKGKGKRGPPPPPSGEAAAKARAEHEAKKKERMEKEKREAQENIEKARKLEEARRELSDRYHLLSPMDINDVDWTELKMSLHLVGGKGDQSGGVHLIEFEGSRALCLRQQSKLFPTELVADRVAAAMGVPVAKHRLVHPERDKDEYNLIKSERKRIDPGYVDTDRDLQKALQHLKETDPEQYDSVMRLFVDSKGTWSVVEFVQGVGLDKSRDAFVEAGENLLQRLGRLCALDVLLNNMDRLPLPLWDNAGNLTNVMLRSNGDVVGIDQQAHTPKDEGGREQYLGRVRSLVGQLFGNATGAPDDVERSPGSISGRLRRAFSHSCDVEISEADLVAFNDGLRHGLHDAATCLDSGALQKGLDDAVAEAGRAVSHWGNNTTLPDPSQEASMHAEFVKQIALEIAAIVRGCS